MALGTFKAIYCYIHYLSDDLGRIPAGATDRDKLLSVERDSFLIEAADGSRRRYSTDPLDEKAAFPRETLANPPPDRR